MGLGGSRGFWAQDRVSPGSLALDIRLVVGTGVEFIVIGFSELGERLDWSQECTAFTHCLLGHCVQQVPENSFLALGWEGLSGGGLPE